MTKKISLVDSFLFERAKAEMDKASSSLKIDPKMTDRQTDSLTDSLADSLTDTQTVRRTVRQSDGQSDGHSDSLSDSHSDSLSDGHSGRQSERRSEKQSDGHSERQSEEHSERQSEEHKTDDPFYWMTTKQASVFSFLIRNKSRITSLREIGENTGNPYGTVRGAIRKLTDEKCISKPKRYRRGEYQGFSYTINERLCGMFEARKKYRQSDGQSERQSDGQSEKQSDGRSDGRTVWRTDSLTDSLLFSSSSSFYKNTTTGEIESVLADHPELGYWRQKGLKVKQIEEWIKTAECDLESMVQSLCHCRFEMVDLEIEEKKPVKNVFNWFFRIIEKTGSYPKPKGYKSFQEKAIERERAIAEEKERLANEAREIYQRKVRAERDAEFWEMMNDPDGETYKACLEKTPKAMQARRHKGGAMFESAMRKALDELMEEWND